MNEPIDAEIVEHTQALALRPQSGLPSVQDLEQQFALAVKQRELLSDYIKKQLVPGKHFYQRGTQKPSLAKEGAEIILLPHNLAPDYEQTAGPEAPPADGRPYQITVKCILRRKGDPESFVGSGIGSAGSHKGAWKGDKWEYQPRQTDVYLCHNATLKMAQKSAMIAATINSTAASEFFTQDMEPDAPPEKGKNAPRATAPASPVKPQSTPKSSPQGKPATTAAIVATIEKRLKMIGDLQAEPNNLDARLILDYFKKAGQLIDTEVLTDLPLRRVPVTVGQFKALVKAIKDFEAGGDALSAYPPNEEPEPAKEERGSKFVGSGTEAPYDKPGVPIKDDEQWRDFIIPIPPKGMKRDTYLKHPQTIGELFDMRHGQDEESQAARQRLWGFVNHFEAKGWTKRDGTPMPPSKADIQFREQLDAFALWFEKNHPDEKL